MTHLKYGSNTIKEFAISVDGNIYVVNQKQSSSFQEELLKKPGKGIVIMME